MHAQHLIARVKNVYQLWRGAPDEEGTVERKEQHMPTTARTSPTKRTLDRKNNFGPLKHQTERVYNQNIYYFRFFYKFKTIITWLFTNAQFYV